MDLTRKLSYLSLKNSPACLMFILPDGSCLFANNAAVAFFGLSGDHISTLHIHDLIHAVKPNHSRQDCPILNHFSSPQSIIRRPEAYSNGRGESVWVETSLVPIIDKGVVIALSLYFINADLAHKSEQEYSSIRAIYKSTFEAVNDPVIITDKKGRIIEANPSAHHFFDRNRLTGLSFLRLFRVESRYAIRNFWHNMEKIDSYHSIVSAKINDARIVYLELTGWSNIQPGQHLVVIRNITRDMVEKIERNQFAAIISHEIKNPLAVIKAFTQLLQRRLKNSPDKSVDQYLDKIDDKVNFIAGLITNLTDALRLGTGQLSFKDESIDFDEHLKSIVVEHQKTISSHKIKLTGFAGKKINIDPHRFNQVVSNLIINAVKYSPEADHIDLQVSLKDNNIQLKVIDYGVGIEPSSKTNLYRPFYRGANVDHRFPGLGLGLYLTKSIVSRYNGRLLYKSAPGKGSTFIVRLPTVG